MLLFIYLLSTKNCSWLPPWMNCQLRGQTDLPADYFLCQPIYVYAVNSLVGTYVTCRCCLAARQDGVAYKEST